ncbi:MAG: hypothetical protein NZM04_07920 [Methylacidiphilales bacterium]|nr:hypothetical protein [Candidatus Methylacidiphilales bacterium]
MAEIFQKEYRCKTDILLPSRSYLHHEYTTPSPTTLKNSFPLTIAFAGSIWHFYAEMIKLIANSLIKLGGEIHIYSDLTHKSYLEFGFNQHPNIFIKGYLPHPQIIDTLRNSAHALYSPLTFSPNDDNSRFCFPSKLADYTAVGLPIILHGPPYSSQIKWASQYSDAFIIIDDLNVENIRQSIVRLQNPEIRRSLAQKIIAIGKETFSWEKAWKTLCFHLTTP